MDLYRLTLFVHILAVVVASGVTAVTKIAVGRRIRARTVSEALDWHNVLMSSARLFPICLAVFVLTGGYMMSVTRVSPWTTGFILAGLAGVALLLASGTYLGVKGKALKVVLEGIAATGADQPAPRVAPPALVMILPTVNSGIALAVAFLMVMKIASVPISLGVMVVGIVLGVLAAPRRPAATRAAQPVATS
ncbi:MAG TPA: hypothetical protein VGP25_11155 [Gemmatimonadaceae bacterium]|jgi:hypothetical protein|nr:hypothetical protein [Gemmatimonadaceae bacterium]